MFQHLRWTGGFGISDRGSLIWPSFPANPRPGFEFNGAYGGLSPSGPGRRDSNPGPQRSALRWQADVLAQARLRPHGVITSSTPLKSFPMAPELSSNDGSSSIPKRAPS